MAFYSKACLASSLVPFARRPSTHKKTVKSNLVELKASFAATNWKVAYDHKSPSTSLMPNHLSTANLIHEHAKKLNLVKYIMSEVEKEDHALEGLAMIDAIQRLGIDCYFQEEIHSILKRQYCLFDSYQDNLHDLALCFRLLRQETFDVPAGAFYKFKNKFGWNCEARSVHGEINELMSLYEASQLSMRGEDILDEAALDSYQLLNSVLKDLDSHQARLVEYTLRHPHHKTLARFQARNFLDKLQDTEHEWINLIKQLAKLDFRLVQSQHQQELMKIIEWWQELGLSEELKFVRDQPIKWYMWSMACLTDPYMSEQRIQMTKAISFVYIIDDVFDVYGTLDELTLFTKVIEGWDISAIEQLPDYMKIVFKALDNLTNEISFKVHQKHGWNPTDSLRKTWQTLCDAFLVEAKWFESGHLPSTKDYLKNGTVSSGVHVALVHIFFLLGHNLTKENVKIVDQIPGIISSTAAILRLWDDLGSAKDENQDGQDGSYIECYMKENRESSIETGRNHVIGMISEEWKKLNQECLTPSPVFSSTFTKVCLNTARMVPLMYNYDDNQRLPCLEEYMKFLLYDNLSFKKEKGFLSILLVH